MKNIKITLTKEQKNELKRAEKEIVVPQLLKRINCVKLKDKEWKNVEIADFAGVRIETLTVWFKAYSGKGIEGLLSWGYEGRSSFLTDENLEQIRTKNYEKPFDNASEAKEYIFSEFGIDYNLSWVQKLLKKNWVCHTRKQN